MCPLLLALSKVVCEVTGQNVAALEDVGESERESYFSLPLFFVTNLSL